MSFEKSKLEKQLMEEVLAYAGAKYLPFEDAKALSNLIAAYDKGSAFILLAMPTSYDVLEKYPNLYKNWDNMMIRYKKQGLFPNWDIELEGDTEKGIKKAEETDPNTIFEGFTMADDMNDSGFDDIDNLKQVAMIDLSERQGEIMLKEKDHVAENETDSPGVFIIQGGILKKYEGTASSVIIPDLVEVIGERAFEGCTTLENVIIPNSVTSIEMGAFRGCSSLTSVTIPGSVDSIGKRGTLKAEFSMSHVGVFGDCVSLNTVIIQKGVRVIGEYAFYNCTHLEYVTIPDSVTEIGWSAFEKCESLNDLSLPRSIHTIGDRGFAFCKALSGIIIHDTVEYIGHGAFWNCIGLTSVTIPSSVTSFSSAFSDCTGLKSVNIQEGITLIDRYAFNGCISLTEVAIPNTVTKIGDSAFGGCTGLITLVIPGNVKTICDSAFYKCSGLKTVLIHDGATEIGDVAFAHCTRLESIVIPDSVSKINISDGWGSFVDCPKLNSIIVSKWWKLTHRKAYDYLKSVTQKDLSSDNGKANIIPNMASSLPIDSSTSDRSIEDSFSVTHNPNDFSIDNGVLKQYIGTSPNVVIPYSVTAIGDGAFRGNENLVSVLIPNSVTKIGEHAFADCRCLSTITIPGSVKEIGSYWIHETIVDSCLGAFMNCTGLKSVTIQNGVRIIGIGTFRDCVCLDTITIPDSVSSVGHYAFSGCKRLTTVNASQGWKRAHAFKFDPPLSLTQKRSGCYVATAVYGSYDCPQVWTLRRFRDDTLAATWYGRALIRAYYAISPTLVKWFGNTQWFRSLWKPRLDRMVGRLNAQGVENTPYSDRKW